MKYNYDLLQYFKLKHAELANSLSYVIVLQYKHIRYDSDDNSLRLANVANRTFRMMSPTMPVQLPFKIAPYAVSSGSVMT